MSKICFQPLVLFASSLWLGFLPGFCGSVRRVVSDGIVSENSTRFPAGTVCVARQKTGGTLLWATSQKLHNARTGAEFVFPKSGFVCKRIVWSADQKRLLVLENDGADSWDLNLTDAYVLDVASLHLVRHFKTRIAWWQGSHYAYVEGDEEPYRILSSTGRRCIIPHNVDLLAADPQTGYLLGATLLPRRHHEEEWGPAYLLQLWKLTARGGLQRIRTISKAYFDPGSSGSPSTFGMAGKHRFLVGSFHGGAYETLNIAEGRRMTPLFADKHSSWLISERGPFMAENTLFGIVRPLEQTDRPRKERFLYHVSDKKITLQQIRQDVAFVYYDPIRQAIGIASPAAKEVVVRYLPIKTTKRKNTSNLPSA